MKIKIPNFKTFELSDYKYLVANKQVFVLNRENNQAEALKSGKKVVLPKKYYEQLKAIEHERVETPIGIWITPTKNQ